MPSWRLTPKKKPADKVPPNDETAAKRKAELKARRELAKKKPVTTGTPAQYGLPGNPHNKLVQDLIAGLQDGTIVLRSIDVRRTASKPYIDMVIEAIQTDVTTPTVPQKLHAGPTGPTGATGAIGVTGATGPAPATFLPAAAAMSSAMSAVARSMSSVSTAIGTPPPPNMLQTVQNLPGAKSYGLKLSTGEEPITGFRDFKLTQGLFGYALQSRNGAVWPGRKKMVALCNGNPFVPHDVPEPSCSCGIYAYDTPANATFHSTGMIWGEIAMWGEVLVCETGYRAEFAYPTALFLLNSAGPNNRETRALRSVKEQLEDTYGVPVFILAQRASKTAADLMQEILQRELGDILKEES